jgi:hypothetical protein
MRINENNILMRPFFYLLLLLCHQHLFGQTPARFSRLYDENNLWQGIAAVIEVSDQSYLFAGRNIGFWKSDYFMWNCLLNEYGDTISSVKVVSGDSSTYYIGFQALVGENKHFFMAGSQVEYIGQALQYSDGYLMKIDEKGSRIWQKNYGGSNYEAIDALTMTHNNELVIAGVSHSFGDSIWGDIYVVKTDTAGEILWEKTLGDTGFPERCFGMDTTADGGFVLSGIQGFEFGGMDIFVMKIDEEGDLVWVKTFGYPQKDDNHYPRIRCLKNGDVLLTTALRPGTNSRAQAYMARLSSLSGDVIWEKYYPGGDWHTWFGFAAETPGGSLVNAGAIMEQAPTDPNYNVVLGALTKTDAQGELIWQRKYYTRHDIDNYFFCMTPTSDAGFLMGGIAFRIGNNRQDAWAVKVDSLGCLEPGCDGSVAAPEPGAAIGLSIRPNPVADWLAVASPEAVLLGLRLTDLSGRVLEDVQFFRQHGLREYRLSLAALPPGLYVLSVRTEKGWVVEKVVKQ